MFSMKNDLNSINILNIGSHKSFPIHYSLVEAALALPNISSVVERTHGTTCGAVFPIWLLLSLWKSLICLVCDPE